MAKITIAAGAILIALGLIGFLGGAFSFLRPLLSGGELKPMAAAMQALMALTCAGFVGLCVKSFVDTRRARNLERLPKS